MVAESALNTISDVADPLAATVPAEDRKRSHVVDPLTAVVPVKSRTRTAASLSTCSVTTELSPESRDVDVVDTRGEDGARDGAANDTDVVTEHAAAGIIRSSSSSLPHLTSCGDHIDAMFHSFYSSLELGTAAMVSSCACSSSTKANGDMQSSLPGTDSMPTARVLFAASVSKTMGSSKSVAEPDPLEKRKSQDKNGTPKIVAKPDSDTTKPQQPDRAKDTEDIDDPSIKTEAAAELIEAEGTTAVIKNQDLDTTTKTQSGCCSMSALSCCGGVQVDCGQEAVTHRDCDPGEEELKKTSGEAEAPILSLDEIIGDTINITSSKVHILDTFSDDNTNSSANPPVDFVSPRAKYLLEEIEQIESQLVEVRKTVSNDKIDEIKMRQDPFIEKMATIKQDLLDSDTTTKTQSGCCFMSFFSCSGGARVDGDQEAVAQRNSGEGELKKTSGEAETPILSLDEIIGDTLNITSSKVHILDTFSDDKTNSSANPPVDFVSPRAKYLLEEIEQIESQLIEVRKTASNDKIDEIKKRQDPFIEKMATIKQHLLDQQELLQSAPEDAKKDYYHAISHAAMLNAEVETRRAELELKKIRLESMKVEEEMDLMMGLGDSLDDTHTCSDSLDLTVSTKESGEIGAFDAFARFTANKFRKMRKRSKGKKEESL